MRLTLRTMLAYLDDILEPEDASDIGKKIAESDFANSLVHRTRDCVHRQRLGTPALVGKGLGADANTVAEYLDNTLEGDRVPEFEKVCLESDMHLAEVASCHQILTLVLGEPAEIDSASRERMYQIIHQAETSAATEEAVQPTKELASRQPPVAEVATNGKRHRPEVPDYLRESEKAKRWPLVSTIAIAALVTLAILLVAGPPGLRQQISGLFGGRSEPEVAPADEPREPIAMPGEETEPPSEVETIAPGEEPKRLPSEEPTIENPETEPRTPGPGVDDEPAVEPAPAEIPELNLPRETDDLPSDSDAEPPVPADRPGDRPAPQFPTDEVPSQEPPLPTDESDEPVNEAPLVPEEMEDPGEEPSPNPLRGAPKPRPELDIAAAAGAEVGRYLTDTEVAAVFDREQKAWRRLPPRSVLAAGDEVVTLPSFRPAFGLVNGVTIEVAGPSLMAFEGLDEQGIPVVNINFGRLRMLTVGKAGNQVHLRLGQNDLVLTFVDAQSTLALEVASILPPGSDPEAGPREMAVDLYATSGQIAYGKTGEEEVVKAFNHVALTPVSAATIPAGQLPEWTTRNVLSPQDKMGVEGLEPELPFDQPLSLKIKEASQHRRTEVRALAIRCGAYLGDFEAFVSALNDTDQRASWPAQVDALKAAVARGPQAAALVRQTLEQQRGADAKPLYRMLWGYTADQLAGGEAQNLVDGLNSESLDIRVLSFWNLQNITGVSLFYRPEYPEVKRRSSLTKWRERLNDGKIVPLEKTSMRTAAPRRG